MGLSAGASQALKMLGLFLGIFINLLIACCLLMLLACVCVVLLTFSLNVSAKYFVGFAVSLYARASKAVSSRYSSTSELPYSETNRRRDLISLSAIRHEYPGVIPSSDSRSERMLNRYGRYLELTAGIANTNATIFRIRNWLRKCEQNHNGRDGNPHCQPLDEDGRGYPLWLIDIEQRCVVPFQASLSYFALSYVWGQVETAKLEISNVVQLQQPGSLLGPHQVVELPKTIKDAMFMTGFLGHRYLWCDRLCLVQDDISSKLPQIQQMAEIYARAYCTIIALDNLDANSGLGGLPSLTRCSSYLEVPTSDTERAHWSSRAWTFQEELFSVRIIQLSSHAVNWQCSPLREKKSTYGSNRYNSDSIRSLQFISDIDVGGLGYSVQVGGMFCPRHASLAYYINLAEEYSRRHVNEQHPEDRIHAFSSVQSVLKASYPGAFIQGIPECLLVQCLRWETGASSRKDFDNPITGRKASSWSWIAWSAPIYYTEFTFGFRAPQTREGLVSWYVSLNKDSRRYQVSVAKEESWARHKKVEGRSSAPILPLNASSTGRLDMSLESQGFEHIVPLSADSPEPLTLEVKNLCSFLHGRVLIARFRVHVKYTRSRKRRAWVLSCETNGGYAGVLCGLSDLLEEGQVISLIAISEGSYESWQCCKRHRRPILEPEESFDPLADGRCRFLRNSSGGYFRIHPKPDKIVYEFYDALWVEYEDGVAYRKAIGRVRKEVWDRETLGWVDVTLG